MRKFIAIVCLVTGLILLPLSVKLGHPTENGKDFVPFLPCFIPGILLFLIGVIFGPNRVSKIVYMKAWTVTQIALFGSLLMSMIILWWVDIESGPMAFMWVLYGAM